MRIALVLIAAALLGCAQPQEPSVYRDVSRPISSMAVIEQHRLDGDWHEVAGFGAICAASAPLKISGSASKIEGSSCFLPFTNAAAMTPSGPGRFRIEGQDYWLIWSDFDYRTLVFGTPSGAFGAILNRGGPISDDRLEAARRILSFNGYDLTKFTRR